jgi:riboflavin kinase/FMN adenylyltransferase
MKLIRHPSVLQPIFTKGSAVTIGNFDGVHLGHQQILQALIEQAKQRQLPSVLVTFEPSPQEYFSPQSAPARLTNLREKLSALQKYALDYVVVIKFNRTLAQLSPQAFVQQVLLQKLQTRYLIVGDDFRFGKQRTGDFALLQSMAQQYGFCVEALNSVLNQQHRVSSTLIRKSLQQADFALAEQLLGRRYQMQGRIVHGDKRGRQLGFPTLNIPVKRWGIPLQGVYLVTVKFIRKVKGINSHQALPGVANIGCRPTINGKAILLEVHLLDFNHKVYGQHVQVTFLQQLRGEKRFASLEALQAQIAADKQLAERLFSKQFP